MILFIASVSSRFLRSFSMKSSPILCTLIVAGAVAGLPSFAKAQQPATIVTTSHGEVDVKPDRAKVQFSVETRASTAAAAAADNSRRQRAVLDTLQKLGITADQMQTSNLQVTPEMVYPGQGLPPKVSGYVARNAVRVDVIKLEQTGTLIDAGLAKGSTGIGGGHGEGCRTAARRTARDYRVPVQ
jgi:uncharacterized protein YggE